MQSERRRGATDAPTRPQHLQGRNVNRMEESSFNAVMRFAGVTQPPPNADLGNAYRHQMLISLTNVPRGIVPRNGGGVSNANAANSILSQPVVTVVNPGGLEALRAVMRALQEVLQHYDENNNNNNNNNNNDQYKYRLMLPWLRLHSNTTITNLTIRGRRQQYKMRIKLLLLLDLQLVFVV